MDNLQAVINVLKRGHNSALQLDTLTQGDNALLVQEIMGSLSKAITSLEKAPAKDKKRKVQSAKEGGENRRNIDAKPYTKVLRENPEDTYVWRKYGQKEIHGLKYPRCYYRCTHKYDLNCQATKQVQQSEEDPSKYEILYIGHHTCTEFYNQETESSAFVIDFGSNPAVRDSKNFPFSYSSSVNSMEPEVIQGEEIPSNPTVVQNTTAMPDPMLQVPFMDYYMPSPSIQSSSGSAGTTVDFDDGFRKFNDSYSIDQFDQFLTAIDNSSGWNDFAHR